jgi:hypothetical protein
LAISLQKELNSLWKGAGGSNASKWGLAEMVLGQSVVGPVILVFFRVGSQSLSFGFSKIEIFSRITLVRQEFSQELAISLQKESNSLQKGAGGSNASKWGLVVMMLGQSMVGPIILVSFRVGSQSLSCGFSEIEFF